MNKAFDEPSGLGSVLFILAITFPLFISVPYLQHRLNLFPQGPRADRQRVFPPQSADAFFGAAQGRFDAVLAWDVLNSLRRTGVF